MAAAEVQGITVPDVKAYSLNKKRAAFVALFLLYSIKIYPPKPFFICLQKA
jgi:hypothetical protein